MELKLIRIKLKIKQFMAFNLNNHIFENKKLECLLFKDVPYLIDN